jgi:fumarate reductase iron-sulfur subunit
MKEVVQKKLKVSVYRYDSATKQQPYYDHFEVPSESGMTPLEILIYIQKNLDSSLAFRYECRQGICGTCGIMMNGKPVLSCSTHISTAEDTVMLEPLTNFPVEKDLIVNIQPILDRYMKVKPYLDKIKEVQISRTQEKESKPFRKCIECGCCIAGSQIVESDESLDPMSLVKIARYLTDPRDGASDERLTIAQKGNVEQYTIEEGKKLTQICPRGVPIDQAIALLKKNK